MTDFGCVIQSWLAILSPASRMKYGQALRLFSAWVGADGEPEAVRALVDAGRAGAKRLAIGWRDSMLAAGRAPGTVAGLVAALSSVVKHCRDAGIVEWVIDGHSGKVSRVVDRSGPQRWKVEQLLAHLDELAATGDRKAIRDVAIVRLLHNAALRRFEACGLRLADVDLEHAGGAVVYALRKGRSERQAMTIGTRAAESLRAWLAVRGTASPMAPLFVRTHAAGENPGRLSGEAVRLMLSQRAREAGLRGACRPHGLRHSAATFLASYGNLHDLQKLGGWQSVSGAAPYIDDLLPVTRPRTQQLLDV